MALNFNLGLQLFLEIFSIQINFIMTKEINKGATYKCTENSNK